MEGSLFLLKRSTQPRFRIVILNKKSQGKYSRATSGAVLALYCWVALSICSLDHCTSVADNFVEDILGDFKFEVASPYILYRSKSDEVLHLTNTGHDLQQLRTAQAHGNNLQVIGIWFYNENESAMVSGLLQRITTAYTGQSPPDQPAAAVRGPSICTL